MSRPAAIFSAAGTDAYKAVDLGTLGGDFGNARGINDAGDIVGYSNTVATGGAPSHATLWPAEGGPPRDLGTLGGTSSVAFAINSARQMAGYSYTFRNEAIHATLWTAGGDLPRDLDLNGPHSVAHGINQGGDAVGWSRTPGSGPFHATVWPAGGAPQRDLGTLGGTESFAYGINSALDVVGQSRNAGDVARRATLWLAAGGPARDLGTLGGMESFAYGINDAGHVVGWSHTVGGYVHATLWRPGSAPQDLGTLGGTESVAHAINAAGDVVGYSYTTGNVAIHATLWPAGGGAPRDLGTLGGTESVAYGINTGGLIVGYGRDAAGRTRGILWRPNAPPLADAGGSQTGDEGSPVTFDASRSTDPDGDALTYTWDFGDGSAFQTVSTPTVQHTYDNNKPDGSPYSVTVTVTDIHGATSAPAATSALIRNVAPTASFNPATTVGEGSFGLALTGVQDAPGDVPTLEYAFDCGGGAGYGAFGSFASTTCQAPDNGPAMTVRAKVRDEDGGESEYTGSVTLENVAPTVAITSAPPTVKVKTTYTLQISFSDPGSSDAPWIIQTDWGDGKKPSTQAASAHGSVTQTHTYTTARTYTITVRVTDKDGGTNTATTTVTVEK